MFRKVRRVRDGRVEHAWLIGGEFKSRIIGEEGNRIGERFVAVAFNWAKVNSPTIWHSSKEWEQPLSPFPGIIFIPASRN